MNNIDDILNNLQKQQPQFDEETMLDRIMESLPDQQLGRQPSVGITPQSQSQPSLWPKWIRNISSAAAIALLVVCGVQAFEGESNPSAALPEVQYQFDASYYSDCQTPQEVLRRYETRRNNQSITIIKQRIYEKL